MKEEDKIVMIVMICAACLIAIIPLTMGMGLAGVDKFPVYSPLPIPQIIPTVIQGWCVVFSPIAAIIYGLYVGRYLSQHGESSE